MNNNPCTYRIRRISLQNESQNKIRLRSKYICRYFVNKHVSHAHVKHLRTFDDRITLSKTNIVSVRIAARINMRKLRCVRVRNEKKAHPERCVVYRIFTINHPEWSRSIFPVLIPRGKMHVQWILLRWIVMAGSCNVTVDLRNSSCVFACLVLRFVLFFLMFGLVLDVLDHTVKYIFLSDSLRIFFYRCFWR